MAKKSKKLKKRAGRNEEDQAGCMWSLLNIFDFRHVRSTQKLILDKKRGSKRLDGNVFANIKLEALNDACNICNDTKDTAQNETSTIDTSKMSVKELMQEEMYGEQDREKQGIIESENPKQNSNVRKKNRRWSRSKMSLDLESDGFITGDFVYKPSHRKHKSCTSIDLNEMVEELCNRLQQKDSRNSNPVEDSSSVIEKQLGEAAKVLVNHFTDSKTGTKEGKIQPSKELADALQLLNSNKDKFLKLLQDPNSQLVKQIQTLQDIQAEEGKQPYFFWRKEKNSSRKNDIPIELSRIVLLKPGPPSLKNSDTVSTCSSLPDSPMSFKDNDESQKSSFLFTFAEFKRRLKHAMTKDSRRFSDEQINVSNREMKAGGESFTMSSPSRDHFLNDRIPKSSVRKMKDGKIENEHGFTPEQRVSNIYIEARKHLADIVGNNGDSDLDTSGRKVPRSLGRILSYSGYSSPTICSPRTDSDIRLSSDEKISSDEKKSLISDGLPLKCEVDKSEDILSASQNENNLSEVSVEFCSLQDIIKPDQLDSHHICSEENSHASNSEQNTSEENEQISNPDSSTLDCSVCEKMDDLDSMSDATSKPSPVSVLEPIFKEDDISPPSIRHFTATEPIQPRQIKFEEEISSSIPIGRVSSSITSTDYDKYTFEFVKDVVEMSGLTWDELLKRSLISDHFINPSLIDEVDFLPDLLSCDFNLLFDTINEVVIELCWLHYGGMLSLEKPFVHPSSKGKPIDKETWRGVNWYLTLESPPRTLDQIIAKDFATPSIWGDLRVVCENIGIEIQEAILDELVKDAISCCVCRKQFNDISLNITGEDIVSELEI